MHFSIKKIKSFIITYESYNVQAGWMMITYRNRTWGYRSAASYIKLMKTTIQRSRNIINDVPKIHLLFPFKIIDNRNDFIKKSSNPQYK